jgi:hypothetical protein
VAKDREAVTGVRQDRTVVDDDHVVGGDIDGREPVGEVGRRVEDGYEAEQVHRRGPSGRSELRVKHRA